MSRRRLMMKKEQKGSMYKKIVHYSYTDDDLIYMFGNLFETFEKADDVITLPQTGSYKYFKCRAMAFEKSTASVQLGANTPFCVAIYEDGELKLVANTAQIFTFSSLTSTKHIIAYTSYSGTTAIGNDNGTGANGLHGRWQISASKYKCGSSLTSLYQFHYIDSENTFYNNNSINQGFLAKGSGGYMYVPDNNAQPVGLRGCPFQKVRLYKCFSASQYALFGNSIDDLYIGYELGEVPYIASGLVTNNNKRTILHIQDMGNDADNAALEAEYNAQGWGLKTQFKSVVHDFNSAQEPLDD